VERKTPIDRKRAESSLGSSFLLTAPDIECGVECVVVFTVEMILRDAERFTEALEVDNFALSQEFDRVADVRVIDQAEQVIIGLARLLLCRKVFEQVCQRIAGGLDHCRSPRNTARRLRVYARGVVNKVYVKPALFDFFHAQVAGELVQNRAHHLEVCEFFGAYLVKSQVPKSKNVVISGLSGYSVMSLYLKSKEFGQI